MAHHDRRRRERARQVDHSPSCGWYSQASNVEPERAQARARPARKSARRYSPGCIAGAAVADDRIGVISGGVAHAAEPAAAGPICASNTGSTRSPRVRSAAPTMPARDPGLAVIAGGAHRGDAGDELGLADRPHLLRAIRAVMRVAFLEHGGDDVVVAGVDVGQQLVEQIAVAAAQPTDGGAYRPSAAPAR